MCESQDIAIKILTFKKTQTVLNHDAGDVILYLRSPANKQLFFEGILWFTLATLNTATFK